MENGLLNGLVGRLKASVGTRGVASTCDAGLTHELVLAFTNELASAVKIPVVGMLKTGMIAVTTLAVGRGILVVWPFDFVQELEWTEVWLSDRWPTNSVLFNRDRLRPAGDGDLDGGDRVLDLFGPVSFLDGLADRARVFDPIASSSRDCWAMIACWLAF